MGYKKLLLVSGGFGFGFKAISDLVRQFEVIIANILTKEAKPEF